jgi:hypothetical protein
MACASIRSRICRELSGQLLQLTLETACMWQCLMHVAGLAAAQQLRLSGFKVMVLEGNISSIVESMSVRIHK